MYVSSDAEHVSVLSHISESGYSQDITAVIDCVPWPSVREQVSSIIHLQGILLVYDVTSMPSFQTLLMWMQTLKEVIVA